MSTHQDKAQALAEKITATAEAGLRNLELALHKWPAEFQAIMWDAVVEIASRRAQDARERQISDEITDGQQERR